MNAALVVTPSAMGLTEPQMRLVRFIQSCGPVSPSFRQMMRGIGATSTSTVQELLGNLEARGWIRRIPHRARAIEVDPAPATGLFSPYRPSRFDSDPAEGRPTACTATYPFHDHRTCAEWSPAPEIIVPGLDLTALPPRQARIIALYVEGWTLRRIATEVGLTFERCRQILTSHSVPLRSRSYRSNQPVQSRPVAQDRAA